MLKKIVLRIFGFFDMVKDFLFRWGIKILVLLFILMIAHNIYKMTEVSSRYTGQYKNLVKVYEEDQRFMNYYATGEGGKTVVILSNFGEPSPIIEYKALAEELGTDCRVIILEYLGYGFGMSMRKVPRLNENIAHEIITALEASGNMGPYTFVAHGNSSVYAMYLQQHYPDYVSGIVTLDGVYPEELNEVYYQDKLFSYMSNINFTSIFELTGYERILSYVSPQTFYIDKMKTFSGYGKEEFSVYRNRIGSQYLSRTMVREANKMYDNRKEMMDYVYPPSLPVLQILARTTVDEYQAAYENKDSEYTLETLANNLISNASIQKVEIIECDHNIELSSPVQAASKIKAFLTSY